jgi:hypothetical protein
MNSRTFSRRQFLGTSALMAGAWIASPSFSEDLPPALSGVVPSNTYPETSTKLKVADPSRFTVLQFTDSHFFLDRPEVPGVDDHTRGDWKQMVDRYKPDLVAMTGDLWHDNPEGRGAEYQANCVAFLGELGVPWIYTWGNHDQLNDIPKGHDAFHDGKNSLYRGGPAGGNYTIDVLNKDDKRVWELLCINTHRQGIHGSSHDWLKNYAAHVTDKTLPRYAFFHIPIKQYFSVKMKKSFSGISYEGVAFEKEDGSALGLLKSVGGVRGCFVGHDHLNDYSANVEGIDLVFGRSSGWNGYGSDKIRKGGKLLTANCETGSYAWESVFPDGLRWKPSPDDHIEEIIDKPWINPQAGKAAAAA